MKLGVVVAAMVLAYGAAALAFAAGAGWGVIVAVLVGTGVVAVFAIAGALAFGTRIRRALEESRLRRDEAAAKAPDTVREPR